MDYAKLRNWRNWRKMRNPKNGACLAAHIKGENKHER